MSDGMARNFRNISILLLIIAFAIASYLAQDSTPSPVPDVSPDASPSTTPAPTPSPTPLPPVQNFHQWGSITVFNGLPSDSVRAIAQTPDGVMWFGTDNGIARFDGRRVQNFSLGAPESDRIVDMKTSASGELWIGTRSGAFVYSDGRFEPIGGTAGVGITAIVLQPEVYLGTDSGHVLRVRNDEAGIRVVERVSQDPITSDGRPLAITGLVELSGSILASTSGGGVFVERGGKFVEYRTSPRPLFVNSMIRREANELWFGADATRGVSGVFATDDDSRSVRIPAPTSNVLAVHANDFGVWAGTDRSGLFLFADSKLSKSYTFADTSGGLRSDTIFTLFTDREGVLWIGTNRGVSRFDRQGSFQETVSELPNSNFIRTLLRTKDALYAGSNRGLFEQAGKLWMRLPGFEEKAIYTIAPTDDGLLVGTASGTFDGNGRLIAAGDTRSFARFGRMYAAILGRGVVDLSSSKQELIFADPTASALSVFQDRLWIGTTGNGLFSYDGKSVKAELPSEQLQSGAIWRIEPDVDGSVWIAGERGVFRSKDSRVERIVDAGDVRDIFVSGVDVWAATTTRGLLHARRDERFGWLVSSIGFEQGLPSDKTFSIAPGDGLLIATNRGVVTYRPGTVAPKVIATRILSQRVHDLAELKASIELEYPQDSLLIEVAGQSSRTYPEEFQYGFALFDGKGNLVDQRLTRDPQYAPSDLKSGEYVIEATAFDRDLLASEPLRIRFSIARAPFPWTATALGVLLLIALIGLVWAFVENRRVVVRNRELAAAKLDLANEAERERRRIARDLHDQTLADLRSLMLLSDNARPEIVGFRDEIEAISGEVRRICEDLSPSVLENVGLVAALEFLLKGAIENHRFHAKDELEEGIGFPMQVQLQIYRIAQELLTNIKAHSSADLVEMTIDDNETEFILEISDNGEAFDPDSVTSRGRGIANLRARASMIASDLQWYPATGSGNRVSLKVPKETT